MIRIEEREIYIYIYNIERGKLCLKFNKRFNSTYLFKHIFIYIYINGFEIEIRLFNIVIFLFLLNIKICVSHFMKYF